MSPWIPISQLAKEYQKSRVTIFRWIQSGFIYTLGYEVKRDPTGHWYVRPSLHSIPSRPDF